MSALQNWKNASAKEDAKKPAIKIESSRKTDEVLTARLENTGNKKKEISSKILKKEKTMEEPEPYNCYNGASYERYSWSQSISDVDVLVRVPQEVRLTKQLHVVINSDEIEVTNISAENSEMLVKGRLSFKIKRAESYWCLDPGRHATLHLEKAYERWWESLLEDEPRIEMSKIDCIRELHEMSESEQMKVEELMWKKRQKWFGQST